MNKTENVAVRRAPRAAPRRPKAALSERPGLARRLLPVARVGVPLALIVGLVGAAAATSWRAAAPPAEASAPEVPHVDGDTIVVPLRFRERAGIRSTPVLRDTLTPVVQAVGAITFDPQHVAAAGTRLRGVVRRVLKFEGDHVERGEVLAEIESAELGEAQASVATLTAQRDAAARNARRERGLLERGLSTAREAELAEASLKEYSALLGAARQKVSALGGKSGDPGVRLVRAPIAGTVIERAVASGQSVEDNVVAFRIANLDSLWVELAVFERQLGAVRKGDRVELTPVGRASDVIAGKVAHVAEQVDAGSRTGAVRVEVENEGRKLRPGQSVSATIHASGQTAVSALLVPASAVTFVDGRATVFLEKSPTRIVPVEVELGGTDGKRREVLSGLEEGARVVHEGVFAVKSELFR